MRFGSVFFWMGLIVVMVLGVMGYEHYYKGLRSQSMALRKVTNSMGSLKQDMSKLRSKYDSVLGVDGAGTKKKTMSASDRRRQKMKEQNRRLMK